MNYVSENMLEQRWSIVDRKNVPTAFQQLSNNIPTILYLHKHLIINNMKLLSINNIVFVGMLEQNMYTPKNFCLLLHILDYRPVI